MAAQEGSRGARGMEAQAGTDPRAAGSGSLGRAGAAAGASRAAQETGSVLICVLVLLSQFCFVRRPESNRLELSRIVHGADAVASDFVHLSFPKRVYVADNHPDFESKDAFSIGFEVDARKLSFDSHGYRFTLWNKQQVSIGARSGSPTVNPDFDIVQSHFELSRVSEVEANGERPFGGIFLGRVWGYGASRPIIGINPLLHCRLLKFDARLRSSGGFLSGVSVPYDGSKSAKRGDDADDAYQRKDNGANERDSVSCGTWWETHDPYSSLILAAFDGSAVLIGGVLGGILFCVRRGRWRWLGWVFVGLGLLLCGIGSFLAGWGWLWGTYQTGSPRCKEQSSYFHNSLIVPHKYFLTSTNYWGTVIVIRRADMSNVLGTDKQVAVISALAEGSGIRQIERITGVHRDTIMRLGARVGQGCANVLDRKMRNLSCAHLQFDEVWGFIGKKERHCTPDDSPEVGDVWTFCAIDSDTKIVPSFKVGKRDSATANAFVADVASRLKNRVQISSDALRAYVDAVEMAFGANVEPERHFFEVGLEMLRAQFMPATAQAAFEKRKRGFNRVGVGIAANV